MSGATLSRRADAILSDFATNGGLLSIEQNDTFIRSLIDQPTILRDARTVAMSAPEMQINKIGFGQRILKPAPQGTTPYQQDNAVNNRWLPAADRSGVTTSKVNIRTKEIMAEIRLPYELLEDNIERGELENTVLAMIAERAALDLEELIILGDTASGDTYLALMNGVIKMVSSNVVDAAGTPISPSIFNNLKKALPTKYRRNLPVMRWYTSMDRESDYRLAVSQRGTGLGDAVLTGNTPLPVLGIPMSGVALMPNQNVLLMNPQNLIFGVQRNIRIETDKDIRAREVVIVLTCRIGIGLEQEDAVAKVINLG